MKSNWKLIRNLLCKLGIHKWYETSESRSMSNVIDYQKECVKCHKVKRWNIVK